MQMNFLSIIKAFAKIVFFIFVFKMCAKLHILTLFIVFLLKNSLSTALKCRSDSGPSEAELKQIARSCMRRVSEGVAYNHQGSWNRGYAAQSGTNHQQQTHAGKHIMGFDYDNYDYNMNDDQNYNNFQTNNHRKLNDDNSRQTQRDHNRDRDYNRQSDRERSQSNRSGSSRYDDSNTNLNFNQKSVSNNASNRRNLNAKDNKNNNTNKNENHNNTNYDAACIVHCFFGEMNTLNTDDYPDRYKTQYALTKDIRDRELRNFYTESVQECFRLVDTPRRHDKCQFSRELVQCLMEYARANCDDWEEYSFVFN